MSIDHYENFPVASWLCPAPIRPAVIAIYRFARTADDLADEGDATAAERLQALGRYRTALRTAFECGGGDPGWPGVFEALAAAQRRHDLPLQPLDDLLEAFVRDAGNPLHDDRASLLGYCALSANPVGRLMLHLYGIDDERSKHDSDCICSALQLINFWQDLSRDLPRGRVYLPVQELARHGVTLQALGDPSCAPALVPLIRDLCRWAGTLMLEGAALARRVPGRAGWELRGVVEGGLRILEKIERMGYLTRLERPALTALDAPVLVWRALVRAPGSRLPSAR